MLKKNLFVISIMVVLVMIFTMAGCAEKSDEESTSEPSQTSQPTNEDTSNAEQDTSKDEPVVEKEAYPIQNGGKLKIWGKYGATPPTGYSDINDIPFLKELEKRTGVELEYVSPVSGQDKQAFALMMASRELPDIIEYNVEGNYKGGVDQAIKDEMLIPLDSTLLNKYAPEFTMLLNDNPDLVKQMKTVEGHIASFPMFKLEDGTLYTNGPVIRKDWLDEYDLEIPETIDEWYNVLTMFKGREGVTAPLSGRSSDLFSASKASFSGAFGDSIGYYVEDGKVKFGAIGDGWKEFLITFNKWYKEGLIDENFATVDKKTEEANITTGKSGALYAASANSGLGKWNLSQKENDSNFHLVATPYPVLNKGDIPKFAATSKRVENRSYITTECKNVEAAISFLNYAFTEEGKLFYAFGIEGESFEFVDGKPKYKTDKYDIVDLVGMYTRWTNASVIVNVDAQMQNAPTQESIDACGIWSKNNALEYSLTGVAFSTEAKEEYDKIYTDLKTYVEEMSYKFVMGVESLDKWEDYVAQCKKMKVDRSIELYQQAYDNYIAD